MIMLKEQVYRCQNKQCGAEIVIAKESIEGGSTPTCCCGAQMKKPYAKPTLTRLKPTAELIEPFKPELGKAASG
ncbi:MAG: hypothetical protein ACLP3K_08140 [Candidatus Acidiferrales bacterium]